MAKEESYLPDGYETPTPPSDYMKYELGENPFRIMSKTLMGYIYWSKDNKPVRIEGVPNEVPQVDKSLIKEDRQGKKDLKFFWVFLVYNYKTESIQILEITQVSILKPIADFIQNPKWGSPYKFDLIIKKTVDADRTSYAVSTNPPSEMTEAMKKAYTEKQPVNLRALYDAGDPFAPVEGGTPPAEAAKAAAEPAKKEAPKAEEGVPVADPPGTDLPF